MENRKRKISDVAPVIGKEKDFEWDMSVFLQIKKRSEIVEEDFANNNVDCDYNGFIITEGMELIDDDSDGIVGFISDGNEHVYDADNVVDLEDTPANFVDLVEEDNDCFMFVNDVIVNAENGEYNRKAIVEVPESSVNGGDWQVNGWSEDDIDRVIKMLSERISSMEIGKESDGLLSKAVVAVEDPDNNIDDAAKVCPGCEDDYDMFGSLSEAIFGMRDGKKMESFADYLCHSDDAVAEDNDDLKDGDPHYREFLEKARAYGSAYMLDVCLSSEGSLIVKYEAEDDHGDAPDNDNERLEDDGNNEELIEHVGEDNELLMTGIASNRHTSRTCKGNDFSLNRSEDDETAEDEVYKKFLDSLTKEGTYMVFTMLDFHIKLIYDEEADEDRDGQSSSDSELEMDINPLSIEGYTPFVTSKSYQADGCVCCQTSNRNEHSPYTVGLLEILRRPYNEEEYRRLLYMAEERKPVECVRNLRAAMITYSTEEDGLSYLDHHTELAEKIEEAKAEGNRPKVLNFLRGFFYWLQNLVHEGVFKPWMDSLCLENLVQPLELNPDSDRRV